MPSPVRRSMLLSTPLVGVLGLLGAPRGPAPVHARGRVVASNSQETLLIVGAGVLGRLAASEWRAECGSASGEIVGVTRTENADRDAAMRAEGITPRLRADVDAACASDGIRWPNVLFCASPSGNDDYVGAVASALKLWDPQGGGGFVFTSSAGVYAEQDGGIVTELSPVARTPRTGKLLDAEAEVLGAGGRVVRLAGLYLAERGAHNAWLNMEEVKQRPDGLINQVHYRDAAACAVAAIRRGQPGEIYLAADDEPRTREQICRAALQMARYAGRSAPKFVGGDGGRGKVLDSSKTRAAITWQPSYATFERFVEAEG